MVSAREVEAKVDMVDVEPGFDPELEIQPRALIKRLLPRTMFGRSGGAFLAAGARRRRP